MIMEPTELRIGNFIQYNSPDHSICFDLVVGINYSDDFHVHMVELHGRTPININGISPIPITPEWLERLGFRDTSTKHGEWFLELDDSFKIIITWYGGIIELTTFDIQQPFPYIKSIHQLQNLYHALTGQELTVKELTPTTT